MNTSTPEDKTTDFTFYILFFSMIAGALLALGYLISTFF